MARQRIHNRRGGKASSGTGASWISYSDMMAALLLIFVLILTYSLYQYFTMLETKTRELEQQSIDLNLSRAEVQKKEEELVVIQGELDQTRITLDEREKELAEMKLSLDAKQAELDVATARLKEQQDQLNTQARRIDSLIGVRKAMIRDLSDSLAEANLTAGVDPRTGDIMLDSAVFFETGRSEIRPEGKALLDRFIPVYLDVLLRDEYSDYLGEIIIEGHTDSSGTYEANLKLSQDRALQVALYCLSMPTLRPEQRVKLQQILTAKGRSYSDLVYVNGVEDPQASRRVEFKFRLKDSEMISEIDSILSGGEDSPEEESVLPSPSPSPVPEESPSPEE